MWQILLQNVATILLQNAAKVHYKCVRVLTSKYETIIAKSDGYYKMGHSHCKMVYIYIYIYIYIIYILYIYNIYI